MRPTATAATRFAGPRTSKTAVPEDESAETATVATPFAGPATGRRDKMNG